MIPLKSLHDQHGNTIASHNSAKTRNEEEDEAKKDLETSTSKSSWSFAFGVGFLSDCGGSGRVLLVPLLVDDIVDETERV